MPGGFGTPYRPPCGGWPAAPKLYLGCGHHVNAAERAVPRFINSTLAPSDPCEPQTWSAPQPRPANDVFGGGRDEYSSYCDAGIPKGEWPEPWPENTYAVPPSDQDQTTDFSTCNKRGFKNVFAIKAWPGMYPMSSQETQGPRYYSMNGDTTCLIQEPAVVTPSSVKYLTMKVDVTYSFRRQQTDLPDEEVDEFMRSSCTVNRNNGKRTGSISRSASQTQIPAIVTAGQNANESSFVADYGGWLATLPEPADSFVDGTNPSFGWERTEVIGDDTSTQSVNASCSFGDYSGVSASAITTASGPSGTSSVTVTQTRLLSPTSYSWTRTTIEAYTYQPSGVAEGRQTTLEYRITLSDPITFAEINAECNALLATWNLGDDIQYPWRTDATNAHLQIFTELDSTNVGTNAGPLVTRNERGNIAPGIWPDDIPDPENPGDYIPWTDDSMPPHTNYPDGGIVGAPLPNGYEAYFDFGHIKWEFRFNLAMDSIDLFPQFFGGYSPWPHATQWIENNICRQFPTGPFISCAGIVNSESFTSIGTPIKMASGGLLKCKWAEVYVGEKRSHNYFRPCGDDVRATWGADYRPICGRIAITSATQNGANVDIVLSEAAPGLATADAVDFTDVPGLGAGLSVVVVDSTHFYVAGTLTDSPTIGGYVSSNGAPSYAWHDDQRKGDFVYKVWINEFRDFLESYRAHMVGVDYPSCSPHASAPIRWTPQTPTPGERDVIGVGDYWLKSLTCSQYCVNPSPCGAVIYVSPNTETGHANSITLPLPGEGIVGCFTYGSLYLGQIQQLMSDPLGVVAYEEARCAVPSGAPALPAGASAMSAGSMQYDFTLTYEAVHANNYHIYGEPVTAYQFAHTL